MPQFSYVAKTGGGETTRGTITADNEHAAVEAIARGGAHPVDVRPKHTLQFAEARPFLRAGRPRKADVAAFLAKLADLLKAGVPMQRALTTLAKQDVKRALGPILGQVAQEVAAGDSLHDALARHPAVFPKVVTSVVRAGETAGFLEDALRRVAGFLERELELRSRVYSAMAYPVLLLTLGTIAVSFLLVFFIPKFTAVFQTFHAQLPWMTRTVIAVGDFFRQGWWAIGGGIVLGAVGLRMLRETPRGARFLESVRLKVPVLGDLARKQMVSRFTRTLGALLANGVPLVEALGIAREALASAVYEDVLAGVASEVRQGRSLAAELERTGLFPAEALDMIAVGEEAATLEGVLAGIADAYDRHVDRSLRTLVTLLEPALLVVMAALVGFIVIAMLLPVLTISGVVR